VAETRQDARGDILGRLAERVVSSLPVTCRTAGLWMLVVSGVALVGVGALMLSRRRRSA
jgi:LPXTG-motif cell wall-anchored protein